MSQTAEYRAVVNNTSKLVTGISTDNLTVANKLISKGLIPPNFSLQGIQQQDASNLVKQVTCQVDINSQNFQVLLDVLKEIVPLKSLAEQLEEAYMQIRKEKEVIKLNKKRLYYH